MSTTDDADALPGDLVALLRCPVHGTTLRAERVAGGTLLAGEARDYPVLLGIPRLVDDPLRVQLVALLRAGHRDAAERLVLRWPTFATGDRVRRRIARDLTGLAPGAAWLGRLLARFADGGAIRAPAPSFIDLIRRHGTGFYTDWFIHRFSARTFMPIVGLAGLLPGGQPTLEIGNGCGHSTFVLGRHAGEGGIVALDHAFAQLHAAKRFIAPQARHVCADVERGLPLAAGAFGAVVMNDTFHFVHEKQRLVDAIGHVAAPDALLVVSQMHNGLFPERYAGEPLTPEGYATMMAAWAPRIIRNDRLMAAMSEQGGFDLDDPALSAGVETQASLSLVGRRGASGGAALGGIWQGMAARRTRLMLNPLLTRGDAGLATRSDIDPVVAAILAPPDLAGAPPDPEALAEDPAMAAELLRRRILLDVPRHYAPAAPAR